MRPSRRFVAAMRMRVPDASFAGSACPPRSASRREVRLDLELNEAMIRSLARLCEQTAYAVRSSATAEDSLTASFAGQRKRT